MFPFCVVFFDDISHLCFCLYCCYFLFVMIIAASISFTMVLFCLLQSLLLVAASGFIIFIVSGCITLIVFVLALFLVLFYVVLVACVC